MCCLKLENSFTALILLSAVTFTIQQELGYPMITVNCTTDYTVQSRSIHISWLLNSRQPAIVSNRIRAMRVQRCGAIIKCENGYIHLTDICNNETLIYGWNVTNIPMSETSCNVTVEYDDFDDYLNIMYSSTEVCSFSDPVEFIVDMYDTMENPTVGDPYEIKCEISTNLIINSGLINYTWIGPNNETIVTHNRINVTTTTSIGKNHTSILQFLYLSENDHGLYICLVTLLNVTDFALLELEEASMPLPKVSVTALNKRIGSPLLLRCDVTTVRGITSDVDIVWKINNTETMKSFNAGNVAEERTSYVYYYNSSTNLSPNDNNTVYQCQVIINASPLINNTDTINLNIIGPTDTSLSQDDESTNDFMIPIILIIIMVMAGFTGAGITFGACAYQKKRNQKTQWPKDEDLKYLPAMADFYSAMGKDAPSTCESVGEMQKMTEKTKDSLMPTIDEECNSEATDQVQDMQISDSDEEFDSVSIKPYVTREEMLDQVYGHSNTSRKTRLDKFSISTADSGIDNELDNDSNKSLLSPPPTISYISYQAAKDMHCNTDEMESLTSQEGSNNFDSSQVPCISPAGASSQPPNKSTLLSKFYNAMIKQYSRSDENDCDAENGWPVEASLMLHSAASSKTEEIDNTHNVIITNQLQACSGDDGIITTMGVGSYVTDHCDDHPVLHSSDKNMPAIPVLGSSVGCYILSSSNKNMHNNLDSSSIGVTTAVENGSYIDHYTASNIDQQSSHPTNNTVPPVKAVSYVDHEAPLSNNQSSYPATSSDTTATAKIDNHRVLSKSPSHFICKDTTLSGSYVSHHAATHQPSEHHTSTDTTAAATIRNNAKDTSAEPTNKDAGFTGYVDHHYASQPPASPVHTKIITNPKPYADCLTTSNANQPSSQLVSKTTKSYVDHFDKHPTTDTITFLHNRTHVDRQIALSINQPSLHPTYKSTGSYVDCYAQHFTTGITTSAKGGSYADCPNILSINQPSLYPISADTAQTVKAGKKSSKFNQPSSHSTFGGSVSTGSYIDRYTATYQPSAHHAPTDTAVPTEDENSANDSSLHPNYKDMGSTGYIDHQATSQQSLCSKTVATTTKVYINHQTTSSTDRPSLHPTYKHTGSYVDRYAQHFTTGTIPSVEDSTYVDTQATLNINQSLSHTTSTVTVTPAQTQSDHASLNFTGSYTDCYAVSSTDQPSMQHIATDTSNASPTTKVGTCDDHHSTHQSSQHPISTINDASVKDENHVVQHALPFCPIYKDTTITGNYIDCCSASDINHASPQLPSRSSNTASAKTADLQPQSYATYQDTILTGSYITATNMNQSQPISCSADAVMSESYIGHDTVSRPAIPMTTKESANPYVSNQQMLHSFRSTSLLPTMGESHSSSTSGASDQLLRNSTDDSTSEIGSYVDCYMASGNDSVIDNPKSFRKNTDKLSSKKDPVSGNPSSKHESNLCSTLSTGVYLPYTTAIAENITEISVPSTTNQAKQKPADLFLPSNNAFSCWLNGDKSTFGSSTGDNYDAPHFGEYVAHNDLEKIFHNSNIKDKDRSINSRPAPMSYSVNGRSTANEGYIDCKYAIQQDSVTEQA